MILWNNDNGGDSDVFAIWWWGDGDGNLVWCCGGEYSKLEFLIRESPKSFLQKNDFVWFYGVYTAASEWYPFISELFALWIILHLQVVVFLESLCIEACKQPVNDIFSFPSFLDSLNNLKFQFEACKRPVKDFVLLSLHWLCSPFLSGDFWLFSWPA